MSIFIELLQVAVGTREKLSRVPTALEWDNILAEAKRQTIVGVLYDGLERLPASQKPPRKVFLQFMWIVQLIESESENHVRRTQELSANFLTAGYETCVLKGAATARYYSHPLRRQSGDIDIWVFGRREDVMAWIRSQWTVGHMVWHNVSVNVFEDVPVEVHFHPAWLYNPISNYRLQKFFEKEKVNSQDVDDNVGFRIPRVEFEVVFSLVHSYRHLLSEGIGVRHVADYYYLLKSLPPKSYGETLQVIKSIGLGKFCAAMMWVLKNVFGMNDDMLLCKPNDMEGRFLLSELIAAGNFGIQRIGPELKANSLERYRLMIKHYPKDVVWMIPWKLWHRCWRLLNS